MSIRNATASWSGYSHQGQVGLLIALRKLQEQVNPQVYFVQFETHEDVAIYQLLPDGTKDYLSVHQVKAYYSDGNFRKSTYTTVLNGHFEDGVEKYLHTVVDITDWETSTTTNSNNVQRYSYRNDRYYCNTTEIEEYIKIELQQILTSSQAVVDNAYYRLLFALDHRIRNEHQKASKDLFDIKFSLDEIRAIITNQDLFSDKEIYECRKLFYDTFIEFIKYDETLTDDRRAFIEGSIINDINALSDKDFTKFLQLLNLNETPERLQQSQIFYNQEGLKQVFFHLIIGIVNCAPVLIKRNSVHYKNANGNFVATAIISEEMEAPRVVKNILTNLTAQNLLWENHQLINRNIEKDLGYENPSINLISTVIDDSDRQKFMSFSKSKLIKRDEAKQLLNGTNN